MFPLGQADKPEGFEHVFFAHGFGRATADLAHEIFLEGDLCQMNPLAFFKPVEIAWWNLRQSDKGRAGVAPVA